MDKQQQSSLAGCVQPKCECVCVCVEQPGQPPNCSLSSANTEPIHGARKGRQTGFVKTRPARKCGHFLGANIDLPWADICSNEDSLHSRAHNWFADWSTGNVGTLVDRPHVFDRCTTIHSTIQWGNVVPVQKRGRERSNINFEFKRNQTHSKPIGTSRWGTIGNADERQEGCSSLCGRQSLRKLIGLAAHWTVQCLHYRIGGVNLSGSWISMDNIGWPSKLDDQHDDQRERAQ